MAALFWSKLCADSATAVSVPVTSKSNRVDEGSRSSRYSFLVDSALWILDTFTSISGIRWPTEATFSRPGGDTVAQTVALPKRLPPANTGALFVYSVKTAFLPDASALIRLSSHILSKRPPSSPPCTPEAPKGHLSEADLVMLRELHAESRSSARARRPAVSASSSTPSSRGTSVTCSRSCGASTPRPRRGGARAAAHLRDFPGVPAPHARTPRACAARRAAAQVRARLASFAAYHTHETTAHPATASEKGTTLSISTEALPPVWVAKADTDANYDACVALLLDAADVAGPSPRQGVGVLFGTRNWASCSKIMDGLAAPTAEGKLADDVRAALCSRLCGKGMCHDLRQCFATWIEAHGRQVEVMPYRSRRGIENVLGGGAAQAGRGAARGRLVWPWPFA
ncbi:FAD-linked oxidoreductase [Mycena maculata]|uniref:FAD-linked oxidoreductase n=1 Tax=Mycena maculata TaxID=230809 RepID=A0AAD7MG88_9AGAR|nr:FAD-linked oxidoreductase [Mycena maculata]